MTYVENPQEGAPEPEESQGIDILPMPVDFADEPVDEEA